jgi:hypothetical protein
MVTLALNPKDKSKFNLGLPGNAPIFVNESGLYDLILNSRKPEAKEFKHWVTSTVLPAIRKDGGYIMGEEKVATGEMSEDEFIFKAMQMMGKKIERLTSERDILQSANQIMAPKADVYDAVVADKLMKVHQFARSLKGVNSNSTKFDLYRAGYLYKLKAGSRVRHQYRDKCFVEKVDGDTGKVLLKKSDSPYRV